MTDFKNYSWLILKTLLTPQQLTRFPQDFWQLLICELVHHLGSSTHLVDVGLYSIGPCYETLNAVSKHRVLRKRIQELKEKKNNLNKMYQTMRLSLGNRFLCGFQISFYIFLFPSGLDLRYTFNNKRDVSFEGQRQRK